MCSKSEGRKMGCGNSISNNVKNFSLNKPRPSSGCSLTSNANNNNNTKGITATKPKRKNCSDNSVQTNREANLTVNTKNKVLDLCNGNTPPQHRRRAKEVHRNSAEKLHLAVKNEENKRLGRNVTLPRKPRETTAPKGTMDTCIITPRKNVFQFWETKIGHSNCSGEEHESKQFEKSCLKIKADNPKAKGGVNSTVLGSAYQTHALTEMKQDSTEMKQDMNRKLRTQRRTRRQLFSDSKDFIQVDSHVLQVSEQIHLQDGWTVQKLVPLITEETQTDLEKVRAIWIWLCHNIKYDVDGFFGLSEKLFEPADVLRFGRGVCSGYASLFKEMCREMGLKCHEVSGYSRGAGYRQGQSCQQKKSNHMWNAINLEDEWYLLDACWGAGTVDLQNKLFIPRYDDFFFLTDPQDFIETHWPDDPKWQLLQSMVSFEEFEQRVFKTSEFFKLHLYIISPHFSLLRTGEGGDEHENEGQEEEASTSGTTATPPAVPSASTTKKRTGSTLHGEATVSLGCQYPTEFTYQLSKLCDNVPSNVDKAHGILTVSGKRMMLRVIPPTKGLFDLMIFAKPIDTHDAYSWVCSYQIECLQSNCLEALPENPFNFWGLHQNVSHFGIKDSNCGGDLIIADKGTLNLTFETSRPLLVMYQLVHKDLTESSSKKCLVSQIEDGRFSCFILCPLLGYYRVSVFIKNPEDDNFKNIANLLIHCSCPANHNELFPSGLSNHCGPGLISTRTGLSNPSHPAPIINTKLGKCNITFHTNSDIEVTAVLNKDQLKNNNYAMERYILLTHLEQKISVSVLLPESGLYKVGLFARGSGETEFLHVCDYIIRCFSDPRWLPFPKVYSAWKGGCTLLQPRSGVLQEESLVRIRLKIPEACRVIAIGPSKTELHLTKNKIWEGDVFTGSVGNILKLAAKFSPHSKSMNVILSFEIGDLLNNVMGSSG